LEEKKFASAAWPDACSAYIVKRRLIWRLPGVLRKLKTSETFPGEPFDGLAGRRLARDWRRKEACRSGSFVVGGLVPSLTDGRITVA